MWKYIIIAPIVIVLIIVLLVLLKIVDKEYYKSFHRIYFWEKDSDDLEILGKYGVNKKDKKIISVSLFGDKEYYFDHARKMLKDIPIYFPGWKLRIHMHYKVNSKIIEEFLENGSQVYIIKQEKMTPSDSTFWRFLPAGEDVTFISRDVDYKLNKEDFNLVEEWIKTSNHKFMKYQAKIKNWKILALFYRDFLLKNFWAGFWGGRGKCIPNALDVINNFKKRRHWHSDELFLETTVWDNYIKKYGISIYYHNLFTNNINYLKNKYENKKIDIILSQVDFNKYLKIMDQKEQIKKLLEYFTN